MDASSIITQVSREDEQLNNVPPIEKAESTTEKKARKNIFKSLFCCCFRRNETPSTGGNGNCIAEDVPSYGNISFPPLAPFVLPPVSHRDMHKKCLVIDLDETLVHSSFKPISNADFIVPVEIEGTVHQVYVLKRPFVDDFLQKMGELYECILFTASLAKYADPVANLLDKWNVFRGRLFREHCVFHRGNYVKDLGKLGRELHKCIIMDNSPASYIFHPDNAVPVTSWFDDMSDTELVDLIPFLDTLSKVDNVYSVLRNCNNPLNLNSSSTQLDASKDVASSNGQASPANNSPITQVGQPREYSVQLHQSNGSHNNNNKEDSEEDLPPS